MTFNTKTQNMDSIYDLKLHTGMEVEVPVDSLLSITNINYQVIRVPGGWLYLTKGETTFVPYSSPELNTKEADDNPELAGLITGMVDKLNPEEQTRLLELMAQRIK